MLPVRHMLSDGRDTGSTHSRTVTPADLNYRLTLPDADVRNLLADDQLREVNIKTLRLFDQVRVAGVTFGTSSR